MTQTALFDTDVQLARPPAPIVDLHDYDWVLLNTSGGKDSQTMLGVVADQAAETGYPVEQMLAVHADLGRVEWPGVRELAEEQARHYGLRFEAVTRPQGDLLDQIEARGMFPSSTARYCTSDHKRGQIRKVMTRLTRAARDAGVDRQVRILNVMGMRSQESPARAKRTPFRHDAPASNGLRHVDEWLPIHHWTEDEVWADIAARGVPHHPAYDQGMPRLSCCFCVLASRSALVRAAQLAPDLAAEYAALEGRIGHTIQHGTSMTEIIAAAETATDVTVDGWSA